MIRTTIIKMLDFALWLDLRTSKVRSTIIKGVDLALFALRRLYEVFPPKGLNGINMVSLIYWDVLGYRVHLGARKRLATPQGASTHQRRTL